MGLIKDEPDSGSEACVTTLADGTEEGNMEVEEFYIKVEEEFDIKVEEEFDIKVEEESVIKVEETLDIKEENSEGITSPTVKAEPEVSVWACV